MRSRRKTRKKADVLGAASVRRKVKHDAEARRRRARSQSALDARVERLRIDAHQLNWKCDPRVLPFDSTRNVPPLRGIFGQARALKSLELGLRMQGRGYNAFVCGFSGSNFAESLETFALRLRVPRKEVPDRCYVQNFQNPNRPRLLELPPGDGPKLAKAVQRILQRLNRALTKQPEAGWRRAAQDLFAEEIPPLLASFPHRGVKRWLDAWRRHLLANIHHALAEDYEINVLERPSGRWMSVVREPLPTFSNLFGWIGRRSVGEQSPAPHFTEIRAGALLEADGGVLVLDAADFQPGSGVWSTLKSALKYGTLQIGEGDPNAHGRTIGFKPDPVSVDVKVILVGDYSLYDHLFETEPDFREIFKIRVDFDTEIPLASRVLKREFPALVASICRENGLRPVSASGVARVIEFAVRKAGRRNKVTTQTPLVSDLLREADHYAALDGRRTIASPQVDRAVKEGVERVNLVEEKIGEMIAEGTILITTRGSRIGQVNGLAIYDMGDYQFAKPSRITAETAVGHSGIINIEREAGFSGRSHDKGVQILGGFLRSRFAQRRPLSLTSSVCFEQSYSGIDGDSASTTEIYAILSSLSGLPIRQDIAVTGSLNQKGDIQPIGGVNEKIEGFFDCVRVGRNTGNEGVIIPRANVNDLMLRSDVAEAVARRKFHIYAIDTVEQGLEILTGVPVGRQRRDGTYTPGSVFHRVECRLEEIAQGLRRYNESEDEE